MFKNQLNLVPLAIISYPPASSVSHSPSFQAAMLWSFPQMYRLATCKLNLKSGYCGLQSSPSSWLSLEPRNEKNWGGSSMTGFPKSRIDPEYGWYLQWTGILDWIKTGNGKSKLLIRPSLLPDQGSGCHGFPSMMELLSNHKPKVNSSPHLILDGYLVTTVRKATNIACLTIPPRPPSSTKHALIRTIIKACSWTFHSSLSCLHSHPHLWRPTEVS